MVDIVVDSTAVAPGAGARSVQVVAGATITAGQPVKLDETTERYVLSDADDVDLAECDGIALCGASDGQPLVVQRSGGIDLGAALAVGTVYAVSATAGGIAPVADLATGSTVVVLGVATAADNLELNIVNSGAAIP